jgi:8-oxo-dGTP pyrophosphatase MutT (NUDIX family)
VTAISGIPPDALVEDALRVVSGASQDTPEDRYEVRAWQALLRTAGPALLTREHAPFHVTASAVVLSPDAGRTCLVLHRKLRQWVQPGGHLEPGDPSIAAGAAREAAEETGLGTRPSDAPVRLSRHRAPCRPGVVDWHLDVQFVLLAEPAPPQVSHESEDVAWWPVDALPDPLAPGIRQLVEGSVTALRGAPARAVPRS